MKATTKVSDDDPEAFELTNIRPKEVSMVDRAANAVPDFLVTKAGRVAPIAAATLQAIRVEVAKQMWPHKEKLAADLAALSAAVGAQSERLARQRVLLRRMA
jgi:hypothetical protein